MIQQLEALKAEALCKAKGSCCLSAFLLSVLLLFYYAMPSDRDMHRYVGKNEKLRECQVK